MIGKKFNKLLVVSLNRVEDYVSPKGVKARIQYFNCICDCGTEKVVRQQKLYTTKSCGCLIGEHSRSQREDLTGNKYGRLTVISLDSPTGKWVCQCECGGTSYSKKSSLQSGGTQSCGCLQKEKVSANKIAYLKEYRKSKGLPEHIPMEPQNEQERSKFKLLTPEVLKRDCYTCAWCSQIGAKLNVHHIKVWSKFPDLRFDKNNLVTLCTDCHKNIHRDGNAKTDPIMTILLQGYANVVEEGYDFSSFELTPN